MSETVVSDTGPLLHLAEAGQERHLAVFNLVIISDQVRIELERSNVLHSVEAALGSRLSVEEVTQLELETQRSALSRFKLHQADLSVAALAAKLRPALVLTDDLELRKGLETQGHLVVGSVGVLIRAFRKGLLTKEDLQASFAGLFDGSSLYLSEAFYSYIQELLDTLIK